jgi:hypothetical protein
MEEPNTTPRGVLPDIEGELALCRAILQAATDDIKEGRWEDFKTAADFFFKKSSNFSWMADGVGLDADAVREAIAEHIKARKKTAEAEAAEIKDHLGRVRTLAALANREFQRSRKASKDANALNRVIKNALQRTWKAKREKAGVGGS